MMSAGSINLALPHALSLLEWLSPTTTIPKRRAHMFALRWRRRVWVWVANYGPNIPAEANSSA